MGFCVEFVSSFFAMYLRLDSPMMSSSATRVQSGSDDTRLNRIYMEGTEEHATPVIFSKVPSQIICSLLSVSISKH